MLFRSYMLGDHLLVAPVFNEDSIAEYYLPDGKWTNFFTGEVLEGGKWYTECCAYLSIPLMVKENSILSIGACEEKPDYDYADNVELQIYQLKSNVPVIKNVYNMNNAIDLTIQAVKEVDTIKIDLDTKKQCTIKLINYKANTVDGAEFVIKDNHTILSNLSNHIVITL